VRHMREMLDRSGIGFQERPHWYIG
jgi:hypothetical protein